MPPSAMQLVEPPNAGMCDFSYLCTQKSIIVSNLVHAQRREQGIQGTSSGAEASSHI